MKFSGRAGEVVGKQHLTTGRSRASVPGMAPVRVRGCVERGALPVEAPGRQADASRRRNGPRKATFRRLITVRLRGKSCPFGGSDALLTREKSSSGAQAPRASQQADVGTKTRSAGRVALPVHTGRARRGAPPVDSAPVGGSPRVRTAPTPLLPPADVIRVPPRQTAASRQAAACRLRSNTGPVAGEDRETQGYTPIRKACGRCGERGGRDEQPGAYSERGTHHSAGRRTRAATR
ncbi:hypothetical protein ABH917_004806 [Thermobifida halotolerans]